MPFSSVYRANYALFLQFTALKCPFDGPFTALKCPFQMATCPFENLGRTLIIARSSREMSLTDRILPKYILSRVRISVRPSNFFIREKLPNYRGTRVAYACWLFQWPCYRLWMGAPMNASGAGDHGWAPMNSDRLCGGWWRRLCVRMCVRACVYARVHVCMRDVFAKYDKIFDPGW